MDHAEEGLMNLRFQGDLLPWQGLVFADNPDEARAAVDANHVIAKRGPALGAAAARFDAMTRWDRVQALLLGRSPGLLQELADKQKSHVEVFALAGAEAPRVWWSEQ